MGLSYFKRSEIIKNLAFEISDFFRFAWLCPFRGAPRSGVLV